MRLVYDTTPLFTSILTHVSDAVTNFIKGKIFIDTIFSEKKLESEAGENFAHEEQIIFLPHILLYFTPFLYISKKYRIHHNISFRNILFEHF